MTVPHGFQLIGSIDVDAGLVAIGDPCYTTGRDASSVVENWHEYLDLLNKVGMFRSTEEKEWGQPYEHKGASLVMSTLHGDGTYPVYAEVDGVSGRVMRFMVDFDPREEEEDETDWDVYDGYAEGNE